MLVDAEILEISIRAVIISGTATLLAACWSIPMAHALASRHRSELITSILEALVGIPTVLVGLLLYFLLSTRGPLGFLRMLYTPQAIIVGQSILVTPLIASTSYRVLRRSIEVYGELALSLGASNRQAMVLVLQESLPGLLASMVMGFSRALGELGVALMVGCNIRGYTRVLTTAIVLEVSKGEFERAIALGFILIIISTAVSIILKILRRLSL